MNVFLLISDTFRYDNLFDRASMPVRTPELDRFHQRAVSCTNMWVSSFPTIPHRTDLTSGRYGWPWYGWQPLAKSTPNHMPETLGRGGYMTQLLCDCPHLFNSGFQNGFWGAMQVRGQEGDRPFLRMNYPITEPMPREKNRGDSLMGHSLAAISQWTNRNWRLEEDRFCARTARLAIEWLEENYQHEKLFLWCDFFDPHEPWDAPEYMVRRYDPKYDGEAMIHPLYGRTKELTAAERRNLRAHYCAEAELVDRHVGRVLQKIDDLQLWDDSVVIFTTDHGMSLGEHGRAGKSNIHPKDKNYWPIYPEIAHIPFLIAAPGLKGGTEMNALVQPPDILPTILELAGVKSKTPEPIHGRSFAAQLRGRGKGERDFVVSASFLRMKEGGNGYVIGAGTCTPVVYTKKWAYAPIGQSGKPELFDVTRDTNCEKNLIASHPRIAADLHAKLVSWLREMNAPPEAVAVFE